MEIEKEPLKSVETLSQFLRICLLILAAVEGLAIISGIWFLVSYSDVPSDAVLEDTLNVAEMVNGGVGIMQTLVAIPIMIIFAVWLYRMTFNLRQQSPKPMEFTPGWMVGWYFIPFANLVKPFHGMKELWQTSHKEWNADPNILRWWWGFWLFSNSISNGASRMVRSADTIESYMLGSTFFLVSDILGVALDIIAFSIVTSIWLAYEKHYIKYIDSVDHIHQIKVENQVY